MVIWMIQRRTVTGITNGDEGYVTVDRMRHTITDIRSGFTSQVAQSTTDLLGFQNSLECTTVDTSIEVQK